MDEHWRNKIHRYKYRGRYGWAHLFARLLIAHLDNTYDRDRVDLIVANPGYEPPDHPLWKPSIGHAEFVLDTARVYDPVPLWPWDDPADPAIVKTGPTESNAGMGLAHRSRTARQLRQVLEVRNSRRVAGGRVLIYDDVFTSGHTLNEVARALLGAGAERVGCVVLARQMWW